MNYRVRYFYSRGAFLVLVWVALLNATYWSLFKMYAPLSRGIRGYTYIPILAVGLCIFSAPFSGWLADARYGNFKVFKAGSVLSFIATVMACASSLILEHASGSNWSSVISLIVSGGVNPVVYALFVVGSLACFVTALQLGLDQMPESSAANVSSFIAWFIFSQFVGFFVSNTLFSADQFCAVNGSDHGWSVQFLSVFPVACMALVCCSLFLLAPKWLIIEPNCPQSLKTIYQVLKFAAKHKAPLNRSALTYWEEDVPSRMDLGKSRYGGPFTTEEVEDVKTFFKIIIFLLPVFFVVLGWQPIHHVPIDGLSVCTAQLVYNFFFHPLVWVLITTVLKEFVLFPLFRDKLPSIKKCIGIASFIVLLVQVGSLILNLVAVFHQASNVYNWLNVIWCVLSGFILQFLLTKVFEFSCAQSPYHMRGLLCGYTALLCFAALGIGQAMFDMLHYSARFRDKAYSPVIQSSFAFVVGLIGFILYCIVAAWYKNRVRDEAYSYYCQSVVEDVFSRRVAHNTIN